MSVVNEEEELEVGEEEEEYYDAGSQFEPTFPKNIVELSYSFGYDCKRLYNICLIDDDTLVFISGNLLHYYQISTGAVSFRASISGAGIGFITKNKHPDFQGLLTVGENGLRPIVYIYEFPSHKVRVQLEGAAKRSFTCGSYNSSGELLATQAGPPDFMLTIWRWEKAEVLLRAKSFQNDVLYVHFSAFNPILLVSCGMCHIKFWKMANTFTGLKLQGDLGRFGKTDFSDIYAACMLPDENVISSCEWGNMLLWEAGLIKFEITRKGRKPCHTKSIVRITYDEGEVMTVGMDGYVRIWFWETVDLADPPDDDRFVEIDPIYEFRVGNCEIRGVQKIKLFDDEDYGYYAQDGNGGFWYCDLNVSDLPKESRKLYSCHGGRVISAQMSPISKHLMTLGEDGKLFTYDYDAKKMLLEKEFLAVGTDLLWFNTTVSSSGMELVASFVDGVIRQLLLDLTKPKAPKLHLVRAIKAHTASLTKLAVNPSNTILVTGSTDQSIFLYALTEKSEGLVKLQPIGFITLNGIPHCLNWIDEQPATIIIGGKGGEVYECQLPTDVSEQQTYLSYNLSDLTPLKTSRFVSIKSRIRRDVRREQIKQRKELKRQRKLDDIDKLKAINPGLQIDLETALADSEPDEEEPPLHTPAIPNAIIWLRYTEKETIWVSMSGYDAGYIYEMVYGYKEPVRATIIADGDDCEIHSYLEIEDFLIFGLVNGKLRVNRPNVEDFTDMQDYRLFNMHDALNGRITQLVLGFDGKQFASIGNDGNVFVYNWRGPLVARTEPIPSITLPQVTTFEDIDDPEYPSLEQEKIYAEQKRQREAAAEHDRKILERIAELQVQFNEIQRQNRELPEVLQIPHREMLLDPRVTKQISDSLQAELDDVREDLAYDLEFAMVGKQKLFDHFLKKLEELPIRVTGIGTQLEVFSFRLEMLGEEFDTLQADIDERLRLEALQRGPAELALADEKEDSMPEPGIETFFYGRDPESIIPRFSKKMLRLLKRYRSRQLYEIERVYEWDKLYRLKPDPNKNHPDDERNIREAERNLGDYKLKIGSDYEPKQTENLTHKCIEIMNCRRKWHDMQSGFNEKLFKLRKNKKELYEFIAEKRKRLNVLHTLIPEKNRMFLPDVPEINMEYEYPELNLIEHYKAGCGIEIKDIIYLEQTVQDLLPKTADAVPPKPMDIDQVHELEKYNSLRIKDVEYLPEPEELLEQLAQMPRVNDSAYYETDSSGTSPWLVEQRFHWILNLLDEQDTILLTVKERIKKFDASLQEIAYSRLHVKYESEFMQCYMIAMNQELYILRDSEQIENQLLANADAAMRTRNEMQLITNASNRQIDESRKACDRINEQMNVVQLKFLSTCKNHKFFDFLRRIFKKKYRPPKPPKVGDESSESSSEDESSSEEDEADTKSIDSGDMTTIRLDETHCPSGLERPMYDLAFKLRSDRHALEQALLEQQKIIETKRQNVLELQKQMKYHEDIYAREKQTLLDFRRKRQQELNKVKIAVVLNMSQLQHFYEGEDYRDLSRAVLFDGGHLTKLKSRVEQLKQETLATRRLHRINIVHLQRMNKDIKFMRYEIIRLEEDIKQAMVKKFGIVLNLDDLEEEVLRRHVFELETTAEQDILELEREMRKRKKELLALQEEQIFVTKANSEKLNVLSVLQEEKNFLDEVLASQERNFEQFFKPNSLNLDHDIEKLMVVSKQQQEQIECLEREICTLRMKARPLQMEHEKPLPEDVEVTNELLPNDDNLNICPELLGADLYPLRASPDDFMMQRVHRIVQKRFARHFSAHMSAENVRKYAYKVARYLGHAAYHFEGKLTDRIMDCITEQMQSLLPKKYFIHVSGDDLRAMLSDILAVFDYERSEVNTEEVISGIFANTMETLQDDAKDTLNKTQHILERIFKELIEVLPPDEFRSENTLRTLLDVLDKEPLIQPKCISIEKLVACVVSYAQANLLDGITAIPIRRLAESVQRELLQRRLQQSDGKSHCSIGSVSNVSIAAKKK